MSSISASAPTLAPGQHVIVRNVHVGILPATIEKADAATVTLALAVKDERMGRLVGHEMAVEITSGRGIHRYTGTLSGERSGSLTIALSGDIERIQRREFVRVAAHLDVTIQGVDQDVGGETTTLDVSGSGMRIADKFELPLGIDVRIELKLPDGPPLSALGRVVRVGSDEDQKGIRFDSVSRADEDRLMRYIRDREVKALRASRG
jgi:PilZ domain-containing protein